jgi:hypothetical protein
MTLQVFSGDKWAQFVWRPLPQKQIPVLVREGRMMLDPRRVVYYESIKREPKIRGINKCRCDERLQTKTKEFTRLPYTGLRRVVTGTPVFRRWELTVHYPGYQWEIQRCQKHICPSRDRISWRKLVRRPNRRTTPTYTDVSMLIRVQRLIFVPFLKYLFSKVFSRSSHSFCKSRYVIHGMRCMVYFFMSTHTENHGVSQPFLIGSGSGNPASVNKTSRNWFVCDLQICCHFTTQNRQTDLKTNDETNTFLICLFVLSGFSCNVASSLSLRHF